MIFKNIRSFDKDRGFIAVFDFNGTLIKGNTSFLFLYYLRGIFGLAVDLFNILFKLEDKTSNLFNKKLIIEKLIDNAIKRSSNSQKEYILKKKLPNILKRKLRPEALKRIEWHKKKGHRCLIISSSPKAFLIDISKYLNVELISTYCDDVLSVGKTSQLKLSSSNGSCLEKINLLEKYLGYLPNPEEIEVYGDNFLDKELLEYSRYPHFRSFDNKCVKYSDQNNVTSMVNIFGSM